MTRATWVDRVRGVATHDDQRRLEEARAEVDRWDSMLLAQLLIERDRPVSPTPRVPLWHRVGSLTALSTGIAYASSQPSGTSYPQASSRMVDA